MAGTAVNRAALLVSSLAMTAVGLGPAAAQPAPCPAPVPQPGAPKAVETPGAAGDPTRLSMVKIQGAVRMVTEGGLILVDRKGRDVTLLVQPTSILVRRAREGKAGRRNKPWVDIALGDLRPEDAVAVEYVEAEGRKLVRELRAQARPKPPVPETAKGGTVPAR